MKNNGEIVQFIKQKDYIMLDNALGRGSFAKTVLLRDPFIDELFVAKKYEPESDENKEQFFKNFLDEIKILHKLNHRNVVRVYNYYAYESTFTGYIIMEFIEGVNIASFISDYNFINPLVSMDDVFVQLIDGFQYIEEHKIAHRDIRESNILVDKNGIVKIIDFGIGKMFDKIPNEHDSLHSKINRANSDTLPQEYYEGNYTLMTDQFYLAELLNRLMKGSEYTNYMDFSYQIMLDKMMQRKPENRYVSFDEIKETIGKRDFVNMNISQEDKYTYQRFANAIYNSLKSFQDTPSFNFDVGVFVSRLRKTIKDNLFENVIQENSDVISSIVNSAYKYDNSKDIDCYVVKEFLTWFESSTKQSQQLILGNIISKLSMIRVVILETPF
jgi:serine/threonine-protein kinase